MVLGLGTAHLQHVNNTCVQICHIKTIHNGGNVNVSWCAPVWEPSIKNAEGIIGLLNA